MAFHAKARNLIDVACRFALDANATHQFLVYFLIICLFFAKGTFFSEYILIIFNDIVVVIKVKQKH